MEAVYRLKIGFIGLLVFVVERLDAVQGEDGRLEVCGTGKTCHHKVVGG